MAGGSTDERSGLHGITRSRRGDAGAPVVLRSGPDSAAEPILTMPEGALLTLRREGAENGYVTVAYDGVTG